FVGAYAHAKRGRAVFPVEPGGKRPRTPNGLLDATVDQRVIAGWASRWPTANIGVRTGAESNLVVLDVDGDDGAESLRRLEREHGDLPVTASVRTPSGGSHFWFLHPGGSVPNSAGRLGVGLD